MVGVGFFEEGEVGVVGGHGSCCVYLEETGSVDVVSGEWISLE